MIPLNQSIMCVFGKVIYLRVWRVRVNYNCNCVINYNYSVIVFVIEKICGSVIVIVFVFENVKVTIESITLQLHLYYSVLGI